MGPVLSPAYDMVNTAIVNPEDNEQPALTLNGKKNRIKKSDFVKAFKAAGIDVKQQENIFNKMINSKASWLKMIEQSFLKDEFKQKYRTIILERFESID